MPCSRSAASPSTSSAKSSSPPRVPTRFESSSSAASWSSSMSLASYSSRPMRVDLPSSTEPQRMNRRRPLGWLERHALIVHHDERPAALHHRALRREVQRHDRDLLPPDVQPHIELGPVGQRKHAQALALALAGVVERPELRALLPRVP